MLKNRIMRTAAIDIHPHIISSDAARYPLAPLGGHQSDWSRTRPVTLEQLVAAMDTAGVEKAAIVQASTCYGHDNSYVADAVAAYPKRFTGVFSVDMLAPDACECIHRWHARGLTGMRLFTFGSTMSEQANWLDDPKSYPAWECASDLGLSMCLQMSAKAIPQAARMAQRFPNVRIILDHCARPALGDGPPYNGAAGLFALACHSNVYLKLTPRIFIECRHGDATPESFFPRLVSAFGASRLAWGSNYPSSEGDLPQLLALARQTLMCLPIADQEWIFVKTAQVLYPALSD
jgi:predicted TIM-barrel fold metal-dependent hydrolase